VEKPGDALAWGDGHSGIGGAAAEAAKAGEHVDRRSWVAVVLRPDLDAAVSSVVKANIDLVRGFGGGKELAFRRQEGARLPATRAWPSVGR
jgi:hypothetical protein